MATVIHTVLHCRVRSVVVAVAVAPLLFLSLSLHSYLSFSLLPLAPFHVLVLSRSTRELILISPSRFLGSLFLPSFYPVPRCTFARLKFLSLLTLSRSLFTSLTNPLPGSRRLARLSSLRLPPSCRLSNDTREEKKIHFVRYTYNRAIDFLASRAKKSGAT